MKFSIKYKLLLTFFVATVAVVGAMLYLINWSFERSFLQYVVTSEEETQSRLIDMLANDYQTNGGWDSLINDNGRMMGYLYSAYSRSPNQSRQANQEGDRKKPANLPNIPGQTAVTRDARTPVVSGGAGPRVWLYWTGTSEYSSAGPGT